MCPHAKVAAVKVEDASQKIKHFCLIQLQILTEREKELRKQMLDCKIQTEFLTSLLSEIGEDDD